MLRFVRNSKHAKSGKVAAKNEWEMNFGHCSEGLKFQPHT